ncbi:MAG: arginyl-tRNA synthetase [Thermoleophilaceae bacterium]|nr:arginyl-tRNA synthetase [Thermoleophilaceae bacterium]
MTAADPVGDVAGAVLESAGELAGNGARAGAKLDRPPKPEFGDYSSNVPMLLAPAMRQPPREVAEQLADRVRGRLGDALERAEVAGPGFLNLFMSDEWYRAAVAAAVEAADDYGRGHPETSEHILVEFVSANPTGPPNAATGRHAAYGDSLARILEFAGHRPEREYYVNDYGTQVRLFGESIQARARGQDPPEEGYQGEYVIEIAHQIEGAADMDVDELARRGVDLMVEKMRETMERYRVRFDRFFRESEVHDAGEVDRAIERLDEEGHVFRSEGATWLRTTSFGDDKDRVLMRGTGEETYFGSDIAYHQHKRERGYHRLIDVWGADHHGYVSRMKAAFEALGGDPEKLELVIMQLVNLMEGGQRAQMSKRAGTIVTLDDLVDDIGVDAARFFMLQRSHDTTLDLDLELAREKSQDNPVYYVQYAHARIASILRKAGEERVQEALASDLAASEEVLHPSARALVKRLLELPAEVETAVERRAPHRMTTYAHDVAQAFSAFYRDCRVVGAAEEGGDEDFRIALSVVAMRVIARSLDLLGVEAPEQM